MRSPCHKEIGVVLRLVSFVYETVQFRSVQFNSVQDGISALGNARMRSAPSYATYLSVYYIALLNSNTLIQGLTNSFGIKDSVYHGLVLLLLSVQWITQLNRQLTGTLSPAVASLISAETFRACHRRCEKQHIGDSYFAAAMKLTGMTDEEDNSQL